MTRALWAIGAALILVVTVSAQRPVFKSGVDAIRVDVAVTQGRRPVAGLTADDFELRDSGVRQQIDAVAREEVPLNLVLAIDTSLSVNGAPLQHLKDGAHAAVASLRGIDRATILTFSHSLRRLVPFSGTAADLDAAIDAVDADGATSLNDAAFVAMGLRPVVQGRRLVLLFTDGFDTTSWLDPLAVIESARASDVVVEAIRLQPPGAVPRSRVGEGPLVPGQLRRWFLEEPRLFRQEFLPALVEETGGELIVATDSRDLRRAFQDIVSDFRGRYLVTYSPRGVPETGWHPIEVRLTRAKGDVRARRGYAK